MKSYNSPEDPLGLGQVDTIVGRPPHFAQYADTSAWSRRTRQVLSQKMKYLSPSVKWAGSRALVVQCESGLMADGLVRRGCEVSAVDDRAQLLELARARSMANGYRVHYRAVERLDQLNFPDASFDIVLCDHVFERGGDLAAVLREIHRVLRPGGTLLFVTVKGSVQGRISAGLAPRVLLPGLPPSIHRFRALPLRKLKRTLTRAGFGVEKLGGLKWRPWSILGKRLEYRITSSSSVITLGAALRL